MADIIQLETILKELEGRGNNDRYRDAGKYYFTIFGQPAEKGTWGWRLEASRYARSSTSPADSLRTGWSRRIGGCLKTTWR